MRDAKRTQTRIIRHEWRLPTPVEAKDFEFTRAQVARQAQDTYGRVTDDAYMVDVGDDEVIFYIEVRESVSTARPDRQLAVTDELVRAVRHLRRARSAVMERGVAENVDDLVAATGEVLKYLHVT